MLFEQLVGNWLSWPRRLNRLLSSLNVCLYINVCLHFNVYFHFNDCLHFNIWLQFLYDVVERDLIYNFMYNTPCFLSLPFPFSDIRPHSLMLFNVFPSLPFIHLSPSSYSVSDEFLVFSIGQQVS